MKGKPFVAASCNHGDMVDEETQAALFSFIADFKPKTRIHLGDNWDLRNLRKGASDEEKADSLEDDWQSGTEYMRRFFDGGKENFFLRGNHDERIWNFAKSATGLIRDYANDGIKRVERIVKQSRAVMMPYDSRLGILRLGHLKAGHGYAAGIGAASKHARIYGNIIHGHTHSIESAAVESIDGAREARAVGAICRLDMSYNQSQVSKLRHGNGWAYGFLFDTGEYQLFQTIKLAGRFYAAHEIKAY